MPYQQHENLPGATLLEKNGANYFFFTNERGTSTSSAMGGERTRSVAFANPADTATVITENLELCIKEVAPPVTYTFVVLSRYAREGLVIMRLSERLPRLEQAVGLTFIEGDLPTMCTHAESNLDRTLSKRPDIVEHLRQRGREQRASKQEASRLLTSSFIHVVEADGFIVNRIQGENILVGGGAADAHQLTIIGENSVAYVPGAHASIRAQVLEATLKAMIHGGEDPKTLKIVIGPGLGPLSYEFGPEAADTFKVPFLASIPGSVRFAAEEAAAAAKPVDFEQDPLDLFSSNPPHLKYVTNPKGEIKCLVFFENMVKYRAALVGIPSENVLDMGVDTMMVSLYGHDGKPNPRAHADAVVARADALFFTARLNVKIAGSDTTMTAQDSGAHVKAGRHLAAVAIFGRECQAAGTKDTSAAAAAP